MYLQEKNTVKTHAYFVFGLQWNCLALVFGNGDI